MNNPTTKKQLIEDALNKEWSLPGYKPVSASTNQTNRLDSANLLWSLLQANFHNHKLSVETPLLAQLGRMDASLDIGYKLLNRLHFVDLYFQQIQQHSHLETPVIKLLCQLRPAIIQHLLTSNLFITQSKHPLRQALNDLYAFGVGWDHTLGKNADKFVALLEELVKAAASLPENADTLTDHYLAIRNNLQELVTRSIQLQARACETELANISALILRRKVDALLNEKIENRQLPHAAITFFHGAWRDLLLRLQAVNKTDNREWQMALTFTDNLVFCLAPNPERRQEQLQMIPKLINALRQSFIKAGYDANTTYFYDDIIGLFHAIAANQSLKVEVAPPIRNEEFDGINTSLTASLSQQVAQIKPNQFVLFRNEQGESTRGRLALQLPEAGLMLFVNMLGSRPFRISTEELSIALNSKRAQILPEKNVPDILMTLTLDLLVREYQKTALADAEAALEAGAALRKQSAEKALQEAQALRERSTAAPAKALPADVTPEVEQLVNSLKMGSWLSMKNRLGEQVQCKIAVIYASTGKLVMVDKSGLRVGEYLKPELCKLIMAGEASVLQVADSFENSLSKVIQTLRKNP